MATATPSRSQIRRAAKTIRDLWLARADATITRKHVEAWGMLAEYRGTFQRPLDKVTIQLRRIVGYESAQVIVAQRLKRMPTIVDKLSRQPTMDITRMQDIGGCRAVLESPREVDAVVDRVRRHWGCEKVYDYVGSPKASGYRAVHAVVLRDDRLIEIQLRTPGQQAWAVAVERAGARLRIPVKDGVGPAPVLRYFQLLGEVIGLEESGNTVDDAIVAEMQAITEQVRGLLSRNR
jgi:hypothetical protein